jgi:hypothetical protein
MTRDTKVETLSNFTGDRQKVGVGYKGDGYDDGDIEISPGDVAVFQDPDAGHHAGGCEFIHRSVFVGYVESVYAVDYSYEDDYSVEIGVTAPLGRLSVGDKYTAIITEDGVIGGDSISSPRQEAARLVDNDSYEKYYQENWHLGEDGVPEPLWDEYADSATTGPGCPYCTDEKGKNGMEIRGE